MKKTLCIVCTGMLLFAGVLGGAPSSRLNPPYAFARGWANLMTGWLEIPRGIIYENTRIPIVGFVAGPVKGSVLTVWRELGGTMDVVCFGLTRRGLFTDDVPDFVWDATWLPACDGAKVIEDRPQQMAPVAPAAVWCPVAIPPVPPMSPVPPPVPQQHKRRETVQPAAPKPATKTVPAPKTSVVPKTTTAPKPTDHVPAAPAPQPIAPTRTKPAPKPAGAIKATTAAITVTGTLYAVASPEPATAHAVAIPTDTDTFALRNNDQLDAQIGAMEQRVRDIERRAAIFK